MGADDRETQHRTPIGGLWPWLVLPVLPLVGGLALLHLLHGSAFHFAAPAADGTCLAVPPSGFVPSFVDPERRSFVHLESLTTYAAVGLLHLTLCAAAVTYLCVHIRRLPASARTTTWQLAGILALFLVVVAVVARVEGSALQLTYRNTCELLCQAEVATHIVPRSCRGGAPSLLLWLAAVPVLAGLAAAVLATALASSAALPLTTTSEAEWRAAFARRIEVLRRAFYLTSLILVTSTVTIMLFLQLPLALAADDPTKLVVASHARGMTIFWGTVFTLTLAAIFAPSAWVLTEAAEAHERHADATGELPAWLQDQIQASLPRQLGNIATLMAPLLVGPVGTAIPRSISSTGRTTPARRGSSGWIRRACTSSPI